MKVSDLKKLVKKCLKEVLDSANKCLNIDKDGKFDALEDDSGAWRIHIKDKNGDWYPVGGILSKKYAVYIANEMNKNCRNNNNNDDDNKTMKVSDLKKLVKECLKEVISERELREVENKSYVKSIVLSKQPYGFEVELYNADGKLAGGGLEHHTSETYNEALKMANYLWRKLKGQFKLIDLVKGDDNKEVNEMSTSAAVPGYLTKNAFRTGGYNKKATNVAGYEVVNNKNNNKV